MTVVSIPLAVETVIKRKPFLEDALVNGLINLSALARQLIPEVEKLVKKSVNESAVVMALNRLVPRLELISAMKTQKVVNNIGDITVRSNLSDYTFRNSTTLHSRQAILLDKMQGMKDVFCTFSQGISETTLIVGDGVLALVDSVFNGEELLAQNHNLSLISVKLPADNTICSGVYYYLFKELAWESINVVEVVSTTNEFTVLVSQDDINRAVSVLMDAKKMP